MSRAVLITGARAPVALDIARSFAAAGYAAHLADSVPATMARWSRTPTAVHRHASPVQNQAGFRRDIAALIATLDPVLIVPTCEEVFHLAAAAARDVGFAERLFAPTFDVLRTLHGKSAFAAACHELGVRAPPTVRLDGDVPPTLADRCDALVFKPEYSRFATQTLIHPSRAALNDVQATPAQAWAAQNYIDGDEVCFYSVCRGGQLTAFSAYAPAWRLGGGAAYAFRSLEEAEIVTGLRAMAAILAELVRNGQFACDAIIDANGDPWLIECNARATSGAHLFGRGPDLAHAMLGEATATPTDGLRYLAPAMWLFGLPAALGKGELGRWRRDMATGADVIGARGDSGPVLGAVLDSLRFQLGAFAHGRSLAAETTADIEWNGAPL